MKEIIVNWLRSVWQTHPVTLVTTTAGILLGVCMLLIGFWATIFLILAGLAGFIIGRWLEADSNRFDSFLERLDDVFRR